MRERERRGGTKEYRKKKRVGGGGGGGGHTDLSSLNGSINFLYCIDGRILAYMN